MHPAREKTIDGTQPHLGAVEVATLNGPLDRMTLVATEPLTHEAWTAFQPGEVRVFEQGDCVFLAEGIPAQAAA